MTRQSSVTAMQSASSSTRRSACLDYTALTGHPGKICYEDHGYLATSRNGQHSAHHGKMAISGEFTPGGGDVRGVHPAGNYKHAVGVCDNGDKAGSACDGAAGVAGGGDIWGVQFAGHCKHAVGVCGNGRKARGACDGAAGAAGGGDIRGIQLAECCKQFLLSAHILRKSPVIFAVLCLPVLSALDFHDDHLSQLHQFFIACDMQEALDLGMPVSVLALKDKLGPSCKAAFIGHPIKESATQQQVSDILRGMGLSVEDEFRCPKSGYVIDMRVHKKDDMPETAKSSTGAAEGWAVEFDGPSHFLTCRLPVGGTLMKQRHLELLGYIVVSLPFWDWYQLTGRDERKEYLRAKLHIS